MGGLQLLYICLSCDLLMFHVGPPTPPFIGGCEPWCGSPACQPLLLGVKHLAFEGWCEHCQASVPFMPHHALEYSGIE